MEDRPIFKNGLFGLSPHKVSAYLRQMKHLQELELHELQAKVQTQREENDKLRRERDSLLERQREQEERLQLQGLMKTRAQDALQVLKLQAQQELEEMQQLMEQKQQEHQRKIDSIERQTEHYNAVLHQLLQEFGNTMHKFTSSSFDLLEALEQSQPLSEEQPEPHAVKRENVIQFKVKSLTEKAAQLRRTATERLPVQQVEANQAEANLHMAAGAAEPSSAFWGNINSYVGGIEEFEALPETEELLPSESEQAFPATEAVYQPTVVREEDALDRVPAEPEESKESEAVSQEILSIRNRYIVGKLAGEDLLDVQGRLIVAKGAIITPEAVDHAEKAGRLPDLIVNMKMQGVGEES